MKGYSDWNEIKSELSDGQKVRLMLGNSRIVEGVWKTKDNIPLGLTAIQVESVSANLGSRVKKGDHVMFNNRAGFVRYRQNYRDIVINMRNFLLLPMDDNLTGDEEE